MTPAQMIAGARIEAEACPWSHDLKTSCPLGYTGYILPHGDKGHVNAHLAAAVRADRELVAREAFRAGYDHRGWNEQASPICCRDHDTGECVEGGIGEEHPECPPAGMGAPCEDAVVKRLAEEGA